MTKLKIHKTIAVTLQGYNYCGLKGMLNQGVHLAEILRPDVMTQKVLKVDPATAITTSAADYLLKTISAVPPCIGIVIGSYAGNYQMVKKYVEKIDSGRQAPAVCASCGYNILTGVPALTCGLRGPSLILAGNVAMVDIFRTAGNLLKRKDVDMILAGKVDVSESGKSGVGFFFALSSEDVSKSTTGVCNFEKFPIVTVDPHENEIELYIKEKHSNMLSTYLLWRQLESKASCQQTEHGLAYSKTPT